MCFFLRVTKYNLLVTIRKMAASTGMGPEEKRVAEGIDSVSMEIKRITNFGKQNF